MTAKFIDLTDDIIKALRWIRDNANIYGAMPYEVFMAQVALGLLRSSEGYTVPLPEGSVKVAVPAGVVGVTINLTPAGHMILDGADRAQKRALLEDPK